jgi:hypothetical protein
LGNQVIIQEWVTKNVDGTVTDRWMTVLHWDPSDKKVKMWGFGKGGFPPANARATLVSANEGEFLFESRGTWSNGSQHVAKFKIEPSKDGKTYTWGWSKVSGAGGTNAGPYVFERLE